MRPDGLPMVFIMGHGKSSCEETRSEIKKDVELRGGLVLDAADARYEDHCIYLLGKNETPAKNQEQFDFRYVTDCIYEGLILQNLLDYRVKTRKTTSYQAFNPLDILHGYTKWRELVQVPEGEVVTGEEFDELTSVAPTYSPVKPYKIYSRKNQEEIVKYLVRFAAYKLVKGNAIWQKMEESNVCKGRTWQSMKEHFRKKIIYRIHTFGLNWRQVRRFRATYGLDEEHDSDADSDEEEGEDNDFITGDNGIKKSFLPRRTSSPFITGGVAGNTNVNVDKSAGVDGVSEEPHTDANMDTRNNEDGPDKTDASNIVGARRRRKLFSTNCSFLDDEEARKSGNEDDAEFNVTPVKKKKKGIAAEVIIEEEEDEQLIVVETITDERENTPPNSSSTNNQPANVLETRIILDTRPSPNKQTETAENDHQAKTLEDIFGPDLSPLTLPPVRRKSRKENSVGASVDVQNEPLPLPTSAISSAQDMRLELNDSDPDFELDKDGSDSDSNGQEQGEQGHKESETNLGESPETAEVEQQDSSSPGWLSRRSPSPSATSPLPPAKRISKSPEKANSPEKATSAEKANSPEKATPRGSRKSSVSSPRKKSESRRPSLVLNTPHSVCCRKVNTVDVEAIENLQQVDENKGARRKSATANDASEKEPEESVDKENIDREDWYKIKYRQPFNRGEEEAIVKYFATHGGYSVRGGNTVWRQMEEDWICPGRTWQSLRERFEKHIEVNLRQFGVTKTDLIKVDRENKVESIKGLRKNVKYYSKDEDVKIINFIIDNKRFEDVKGNELWKVIVQRNVVVGRSWQSLKERFRKTILPKINQYGVDKEIIAKFSKGSNTKKEKRIK